MALQGRCQGRTLCLRSSQLRQSRQVTQLYLQAQQAPAPQDLPRRNFAARRLSLASSATHQGCPPGAAASRWQQVAPADACAHAPTGFCEAIPACSRPTWTLCPCTTASRCTICHSKHIRLTRGKLSSDSNVIPHVVRGLSGFTRACHRVTCRGSSHVQSMSAAAAWYDCQRQAVGCP